MKRNKKCKGNKAKRPTNFKKGKPKTTWEGTWKQPGKNKKLFLSKSIAHRKYLKRTLSKVAYKAYVEKYGELYQV